MNTTPKTTKRDFYTSILALIESAKAAGVTGYNFEDMAESANKEIASLDKKAEQAKARAAKAKEQGDALRETVKACLTSELQTVGEILAAVQTATGDNQMAAQKITPRLSQLVDLGMATKGEVTISAPEGGKSRKLVAYALA